jgi:hypothetical protein
MRISATFPLLVAALAISFFALGGCKPAAPPANTGTNGTPSKENAHGHVHPDKGPHGGELIELGEDEYHAELVHDDATKEVSIYILDAAAKAAVPIEATEIVINLKHEGQPEQHKLTAVPQADDPQGKSSRFTAKGNVDLEGDLHHEGAEPRLDVTIDGKPYIGKIEHDAHAHAHADGDKDRD